MEILTLDTDKLVFGKQVETFPLGIRETFDELIVLVPDGMQRSHFGLSYCAPDGNIVYFAASEEKQAGEAEKYNCERFIIQKGEYLAVTIKGWMKKTDSIKTSFEQMMQDERGDKKSWAVEWYKTDEEMICLLKTKTL